MPVSDSHIARSAHLWIQQHGESATAKALGWVISQTGTLGTPVATTAIAFGIGLLILPYAMETKGKGLPD